MAQNTLGRNQVFAIKNADGTPFHDLVLHKATYDSVVMSLGDKITGDVYYKDNGLNVTMLEYIEYDGVKYILVAPPTIVRNGIVSDNSELKGMTKYSFTFYHPMYQLSNLPFSDVAVTEDSKRYLSENKVFSWIGYPNDFIAKIDKNLEGTQWMCVRSASFPTEKDTMLSEVLSFSNNTIADALKTWYDTWDIPYVIEQVKSGESGYSSGKRFKVIMGLPSGEIYEYQDGHATQNKFVFRMGQGLGLKNNSLTPRNNKIVTRISGCGSEDNIPYGYPQIIWYGEQGRKFTYGNSVGTYTNVTIGGHTFPKIVSYPIYKGIVGGMYVELIQHPFTRTNLMPSVYRNTLFNKISFLNPNGTPNTNYNPDITLVDSYDAIPTSQYPYVNAINHDAPSYEYHEFEEVKPELGEESITGVTPINNDLTPASSWDDTMNDDGEYVQSYFKITLPILSFDIYACAAITQEMQINMRSGACIGCTFPVQVDWEAYKENFYDEEGEFSPSGSQRDYEKFPDSSQESISLILQKEFATFGTLMPNVYQNPHAGDLFVVLGISLPESYITNAEERLVTEMKSYMLLNNVHYYDYPLKFDEYFLANNTDILKQIRPNSIVRFKFNNETLQLYVKQLAIKFEEATLPQYDITLTDNIDVVTNPIGKVSDSVDKLATIIALTKQGLKSFGDGKGGDGLSRTHDDTAAGVITFLKGINIGRDFISGILGEGGVFRKEADGKTYLETDSLYVRMKAYFDTVEIKKYEHSSGNRTASNAGFKTVRVVPFGYYQGEFVPLGEDHKYHWTTTEIDPETGQEVIVEHKSDVLDIQFYRCYYRATDGNDTVTNDFRVGDLAFVRETNTDTLNQHHLWRVVVGKDNGSNITENGEGWIDLSNRNSEQFTITTIEDGQSVNHNFLVKGYEYGSDAPMAQDDIVQLGNVNNAERQGAIVEYVNGANSPSYQIYQKIGEVDYLDGQTIQNPYVLTDKNMIAIGYNSVTGKAYMNVYGDAFIGAKDNSTYVKYDSAQKKVTIKAALDINSTVDGKTIGSYFESLDDVHRVFSSELGNLDANSYPKPPYSKGDIWVNAVYPSSDMTVESQVIPRGSIHNNEILVCKTNNDEKTRTVVIDEEETLDYELFSIEDWKRASEYQHTFDYLTNALKAMGSSTYIQGGLILSTLIALRDTSQSPNVWSGISGVVDLSQTGDVPNTKGYGIAAWYGGNAIDYETLSIPKPDWSQQRYARSLFRFDGSGYLAGGNITWDSQGRVAIKDITTLIGGNNTDVLNALTTFNSAFHFNTQQGTGTIISIVPQMPFASLQILENGTANNVATQKWVDNNYVSIGFFNKLFQAYKSSTITDANKVIPNDVQTTINNLKIMVGTWTEQYLSALGVNSGSSQVEGIDWDALMTYDGDSSHRIAVAYLSKVTKTLTITKSDGTTVGTWTPTADGTITLPAMSGGTTYTFAEGTVNGAFSVTPNGGTAQSVAIHGLKALAYKESLTVSDLPTHNHDSLYVSAVAIGTGDNASKLAVTKNGSTSYLTVPYATKAGSADSATSAGKLSGDGSYTAWGRTYWSSGLPQNVSGNIDNADNITINSAKGIYIKDNNGAVVDILRFSQPSGTHTGNDLLFGYGLRNSLNLTLYGNNVNIGHGNYWTVLRSNGHVTVNADDIVDSQTVERYIFLNVGGSAKTSRLYLYTDASDSTKDVYLEYNQTNKGIHLVGGGLYADTYLSALGLNSDSSASTFDEQAMWEALSGTTNSTQIASSHLSTALTDYVNAISKSGNGTNTVITDVSKNGHTLTFTYSTFSSSDTKNTAGATDTSSKIFLIGATAQNANPQTYSHDTAYVGTDGCLYSNSKKVAINDDVTALQGYFTSGIANTASKLSTVSKTAWGRTYWTANGVPDSISGDISNAADIYIDNGKCIYFKNNATSAVYKNALQLTSENKLQVGYGTSNMGYDTYIYGNNIYFGYGTSRTTGITLDNSGNVGIGGTSSNANFYVKNTSFFGNKVGVCGTTTTDHNLYVYGGTYLNGTLGVGGYSSSYRLYVSGTSYFTNNVTIASGKTLTIGSITIKEENDGLHIIGGGLYTDTYLSALGVNSNTSGGSGATSLSELSDVNPNLNPTNWQVLAYGSSLGKWTSATLGTLTIKNGSTNLGSWIPTSTGYIDISNAITGNYIAKPSSAVGSTTLGVYVNSSGVVSEMAYYLQTNVNSGTSKRLAYYDMVNSGSTGYEVIKAVGNINYISETNSKNADVRGLRIWGNTYGNTASTLISGTKGELVYGDGGPQIQFSTGASKDQDGAIIFTDNNQGIGSGTSFHFVSTGDTGTDYANTWVVSHNFWARTSVKIGSTVLKEGSTTGNLTIDNNTILHAGNYTTYFGNYIPKAGANDITGDLIPQTDKNCLLGTTSTNNVKRWSGNFYAISAIGLNIYKDGDTSVSNTFVIDSSDYLNLTAYNGFRVNGNDVLVAKNINDQADASFSDTLASQSGCFFFYGINLKDGHWDWAGIQAGYDSDKWQAMGEDGTLIVRQNDGSGYTPWKRLVGNTTLTKTLNSTGWYRIMSTNNYGMSFLVTFHGANAGTSPVTFHISHASGYDKITQIGECAKIGYVTKVRLVKNSNSVVYLEFYYNTTTSYDISVDITPLDYMANKGFATINFTKNTATSPTVNAEVTVSTSSSVSGDYIPLTGSSSLSGTFAPTTNNSGAVGSSSKRFGEGYFGDLDVESIVINEGNYDDGTDITIQWVKNLTSSGDGTLGDLSATNGKKTIPNMNLLRYWNGRFNSSYSNLKYCVGGEILSKEDLTGGKVSMISHGNEFNFIPSGFNSRVNFNYRAGDTSASATGTVTEYKFCNGGNSGTTTKVVASEFSQSSDMRLKNVIGDTSLALGDIAHAPLFLFTWKNGSDEREHMGTSAQYWQSVYGGFISQGYDDGILSMDYATTALAGVISVARKVVTHEDEIKSLKKRISELEQEVELLKAA